METLLLLILSPELENDESILIINKYFPFDGSSNNPIMCNKEDLPDPEGPTKATSSP